MEFNVTDFIRPHLQHLAPYSSARDEFTGEANIYLDANENPYGDPLGIGWNRYPDPHQRNLKTALAQVKGVTSGQIFLGNGSDEAIDLLLRAFCEPNTHSILITVPTYGMYSVSAAINNVSVIEVLLDQDFQLRTKSLLKSVENNTKIIFLCSPNNPTGNLLNSESIAEILESFNGIVCVDEAYIDYSKSDSWINKLGKYPNLVVLQTFSKAWGMAALRLGVAYASEAVIGILNKIKPPYNISAYTQAEALKALAQVEPMRKLLNNTLNERAKLVSALGNIGWVNHIYPTDANFVLIKVPRAVQLYAYLLEEGIVVRNRSNVMLCDNCLRITVGSTEENKTLIQKLQLWPVEAQ